MKKNSQRGEVVIEASIVVTVVAIFLMVIFYVGMLLYQQTALTAAANKTASNVAMLYANNQKDPFTGYINSDGVYQNITYSDLKNDTYMQELEKKANAFAAYSLKSSDILNTGKPEVKIEIVDKKGELLKNQVVVTITSEFNAPLVGIFSDDTTMKCTAVGRADCVDLLDYINGVDAISNPEDSNVLTFPEIDSCVVTFIDNPDTNNVVAVVPVLKGHSISSAESIKEAHSFWPNDPKIKGIKFTNWVDSTGSAFTRSTQVNSSITVYGAWQCTVTFKPNGGIGSDIKKTVAYGKTVTFPNIERNGYKIAGWYSNVEGTGDQYYSGVTQFKTSCTLYPKWECIHLTMNKTLKTSATCQRRSVWTYKCTNCPYTYDKTGDYGVCALGEYSVTSKPSCTTTGIKIGKCKYCYKKMPNYTQTIPANGHRYASNRTDYDLPYNKAAKCYEEGYKGSMCSACGTYKTQPVAKTKHKLDSGTVTQKAKCTTTGTRKYKCTNAGCSYSEDQTIKKLGHDMKNKYVAPTCQKTGFDGKKCARDGCTESDGKILKKTKHSYTARCGTTHYYYNTGFKIRCYGSKGYTDHEWTKGFQCITCEYCGHFQPMSYTDKDQKLYKGCCRRRYINVEGDNKFLYSSEDVWCVEHKDFDDVTKVAPPNHNIYDCTDSNYKKDSNYDKEIKP